MNSFGIYHTAWSRVQVSLEVESMVLSVSPSQGHGCCVLGGMDMDSTQEEHWPKGFQSSLRFDRVNSASLFFKRSRDCIK